MSTVMHSDEMVELYQSYLSMDIDARKNVDGEPENTGKAINQFVMQLQVFAQSDDMLNVVPFMKSAAE
jgi:hypothetical protein